jgi:hypothetical protein
MANEVDWSERWLKIEERLDFLAGQVHALRSFAHATISAHESPERLGKLIDEVIETAIAQATPESVMDEYLHGLQEEGTNLRRCVEIAKQHL